MNKVILIGRLGADPELKYTQGGTAVLRVSLVTSERWKDDKGATQESSQWHQLVVWKHTAEAIGKYCKKGDQIAVEGQIEYRSWEDKEGNKRYGTDIKVKSFEFCAKSQNNQGRGQQQQYGRYDDEFKDASADDDDIPF